MSRGKIGMTACTEQTGIIASRKQTGSKQEA